MGRGGGGVMSVCVCVCIHARMHVYVCMSVQALFKIDGNRSVFYVKFL